MGRTKGGKNREWSKDQKYEIIKYVIDGEKSINDLGREFGISNGMICNWLKRYNEKGIEGLENKRKPGNPLAKYSHRKELTPIEQLEYENMLLRIENERLKKRIHRGGCSFSPREIIRKEYEIVETLSREFNIKSLCIVMNVSRSGYYKWLNRKGIINNYQKNRNITSRRNKEYP